MTRVLLDQGLSPGAAALLRSFGRDAIHVTEAGLDRSEHTEILEFALRENRICITLDHDFHTHIALMRMSGPSVVLLRIEGLKATAQVNLIRAVWKSHAHVIEAGAAVSVDAVSVRVRKLPLR